MPALHSFSCESKIDGSDKNRYISPDTLHSDMTMHVSKPLLVIGTRPEAIKMWPVVQGCMASPEISPVICFTGQHRELLNQAADYFELTPDINLDAMRKNQSLAELASRCISGIDQAIVEQHCDSVIAQGDTTTTMAASLASFYRQVPFVHIEAGLRTGNLHAPWPEEYHRRLITTATQLHCAPTHKAAQNLLYEGVAADRIQITGNTVIDCLLWTRNREILATAPWEEKYRWLGNQKMVLITAHRRENQGPIFEQILAAIVRLATKFPNIHFLYPLHLNPHTSGPATERLSALTNVHLTPPATYPEFIWLMERSTLILTDSGGVQEEAPTLKKPVVVFRDTTERQEVVENGSVILAGTCSENIFQSASTLLTNKKAYARCQESENPYGDGRAGERIVRLLRGGKVDQFHPVAA